MKLYRVRSWAPAVLVAAALAGCATRQPGQAIRPGFNVYSQDQEIALGQEAAAEIRKQVEVVNDQRLQRYISDLGQTLARQPQAGGYPYSFTLINDPSINAFALPGGPIFVHTGLLRAADNEGQAVGVLAHEIAHVALRHATNQASKATLIQLPAVLAGAAIGQNSTLGQLAQLGLGLGVNGFMLKYSRDAENQADAFGARLMADAGYNPLEMAQFFEKLEAEGGSRAPQFLSSHPNPGNRVKSVQAEIQALPRRQYTTGSGQFAQVKQQVAQLPTPRRRVQQTAATAPEAPSGRGFQQLQTDRVTMAYPNGWEAYGDQRSAVVTIAPREGLVQTQSGVSIGYGAVLSYYQPQSARNLDGATRELIQQLSSVNQGLRPSGSQRRLTVSGRPALLTQLSAQSPYGGRETNMLLTVARPEGLFYMVFVGPENQFDQLGSTFNQMLNSLQFRG
jgi:beta-barrel assembly-enhancing protease